MIRRPLPRRLLALDAPDDDHVVPLVESREQAGERLGRVLQVGVHGQHGVAGDVVERRGERGLVAEVARELDHDESRVVRGRRLEQLLRPVTAAVVHEDHLVRPAGNRVEHRDETTEQLGEDRFLVVDGNGETDAARRHFDRPMQ